MKAKLIILICTFLTLSLSGQSKYSYLGLGVIEVGLGFDDDMGTVFADAYKERVGKVVKKIYWNKFRYIEIIDSKEKPDVYIIYDFDLVNKMVHIYISNDSEKAMTSIAEEHLLKEAIPDQILSSESDENFQKAIRAFNKFNKSTFKSSSEVMKVFNKLSLTKYERIDSTNLAGVEYHWGSSSLPKLADYFSEINSEELFVSILSYHKNKFVSIDIGIIEETESTNLPDRYNVDMSAFELKSVKDLFWMIRN